MSGPDVHTMECPIPDCNGWFEWTDWDTGQGQCSKCFASMEDVMKKVRQADNRALLREFVADYWYGELDDDDIKDIDQFLKEREDG